MNKPTATLVRSLPDAVKRWPTAQSKAWTADLLEHAGHNEEILAIVAIGSAVRPNVPSVDLDLLMVYRHPVKLPVKPPIEIDLRSYEASTVDQEIKRGNDLLGWAVKFGQVIFERDGYWTALVDSWRSRLPLPAADVAARRAEDAYTRLAGLLEIGDMTAAREQALSYITHLARSELLGRGVYPISRPELPAQLRQIGRDELAQWFEQLLNPSLNHTKTITEALRRWHVIKTLDEGNTSAQGRVAKR